MKETNLLTLQEEAKRCLGCKNARCTKHCPISTPIPEVIKLFQEGELEKAGELLFNNNPLSAICAIVCPHEKQCYGHCIKGIKDKPIAFYELEKYLSSHYLEQLTPSTYEQKGKRVAIIGSGPAGLTIAFLLGKKGYDITIFEKNAEIGGMLRYGIPDFRLPGTLLNHIQKQLIHLGVKIRYNTLVGPVITLDRLKEDGYDAIFVGTGVWNPKPLNIKGETLGHVHYAVHYLQSPKSYQLGERVLVIGAGNVAMDAARTAKRQGGKEVIIVYRRDFEDMPATKVEIRETQEDGVQFMTYEAPYEITPKGLMTQSTQKVVDEQGKTQIKVVPDSHKLVEASAIIIAVSQIPKNNIVSSAKDLEINKEGLIITDEKGQTSKPGVFASGDVVTGARTVVEAIANAKGVAQSMEAYLS